MAPQKIKKLSLIKDLFHRRVPQFLGGYILGSLAVIQFIDWMVGRYPISPYLTDFSLVILASFIPTIFILAYFHGKPGRDRWTKVEKIGIPVNLLVVVLLLFIVFQNKDLGATTKKLTVQDETGRTIERVIPVSGFRKNLALFFFKNESGDSSLDWLQYAYPLMLILDLEQDLFLDIMSAYLFYDELEKEGFSDWDGLPLSLLNKIADDQNIKYFMIGSFDKQGNNFILKSSIYETKRGKLQSEQTYQHSDIFQLIDKLSVGTKKKLNIPLGHIEDVKDHPIAEILTNSKEALKLYTLAQNIIIFKQDWGKSLEYLEQAVTKDPTFALAYSNLQLIYTLTNQNKKSVQASENMMQYLYRLPERVQLKLKTGYYYDIEQDSDKGFKVVKLWSELYPDDLEAHKTLASLYEQRNQKEKAIWEYNRIFELDPEKYGILQTIGLLYKEMGDNKKALEYLQRYATLFPNRYESFAAIGEVYQSLGDYKKAKSNYEKASIIAPRKISVLLSLADIEQNLGHFSNARAQYQEALQYSKTSDDSTDVYKALASFYELRGQINKTLKYNQLHQKINKRTKPQAFFLLTKLRSLRNYIQAGQKEKAIRIMKTIEEESKPPFDKFIPLGYLFIYQELEDANKIEAQLPGLETLIQTFQLEIFRSNVFHAHGKIHELRNEYREAIKSYRQQFELTPTNTDILRYIGRCYRKLNELKKSEESIQKILDIKPFDPRSHYEIALVYYQMDNKQKAMDHLKTALHVWEEADQEYKPAKKAREKLSEWDSQ